MPVSGEGLGDDDDDNGAPSGPPFNPPLNIQRAHKVLELLEKHNCRSFIDAGCSRGDLLRFLLFSQLREHSFSNVVAIDMNENLLREASRTAPPSVSFSLVALLHPMQVDFILGDLTRPPKLSSNGNNTNEPKTLESDISFPLVSSHFDAIISIEVLEHINPEDVPVFTEVLFAHLAAKCGARIIIITTPNRDRNVTKTKERNNDDLQADSIRSSNSFWVSGVPYQVRNADHKFEMSATQFRHYCDYVVEAYRPFVTSYRVFGVGGHFTQGAVFFTKLYPSDSLSHTDMKHLNFRSEIPKKSVSRSRNYLGRQQGLCIPSDLNNDAINISWVHDIDSRTRLFPWDAIFGELSEQPDNFKTLLYRTPFNYRLLVSVKVPHLSLWERIEVVVRESFSAAACKIGGSNRRYTIKLRFGDVVKSHNYRLIEPFNASLCALISTLLEQEKRYKKEAERKTYLLSTPVVFQVRIARGIYSLLHWFLHKHWGNDKLYIYLQNDKYGSAKETLSQDEILIILFLVTAGLLKEVMVNISFWLQGACRIKDRSGRSFTDCKEENTNEEPTNKINVSSVDHKWLNRLANSLSDCQIPVHPFLAN
ncbi:methyltransferase type 12 [Trypanosoma theileri]|uniref:Small RNA 2'-O-methyltransferase n=1 Tax=Trypanosoma theileri TaxID=67003 RepID=A0A1X0P832_9TRYP|nr:methyltransferase type 12 [Trypanosoma theileri]ORC92739.1 methyltransferase type 12 [Trypanosoma theileri]